VKFEKQDGIIMDFTSLPKLRFEICSVGF